MAPRLLIIDDEETLLFLYQQMLEPEGYDLRLVSSGSPQVLDIDHFPPDLIILDYHVGRSGQNIPLWQRLKADRITSATPLILCTADAIALYEERDLLRAAKVHVVLKPFDIGAFLATVRLALQEASTFPTA
jgi:two-component system phosphate regulon response regulator PhoB